MTKQLSRLSLEFRICFRISGFRFRFSGLQGQKIPLLDVLRAAIAWILDD